MRRGLDHLYYFFNCTVPCPMNRSCQTLWRYLGSRIHPFIPFFVYFLLPSQRGRQARFLSFPRQSECWNEHRIHKTVDQCYEFWFYSDILCQDIVYSQVPYYMLVNFLVNNFNVFWSDSIADKGLRVAPIDYRGQCKQFTRH